MVPIDFLELIKYIEMEEIHKGYEWGDPIVWIPSNIYGLVMENLIPIVPEGSL